jgi:hypothetical protein
MDEVDGEWWLLLVVVVEGLVLAALRRDLYLLIIVLNWKEENLKKVSLLEMDTVDSTLVDCVSTVDGDIDKIGTLTCEYKQLLQWHSRIASEASLALAVKRLISTVSVWNLRASSIALLLVVNSGSTNSSYLSEKFKWSEKRLTPNDASDLKYCSVKQLVLSAGEMNLFSLLLMDIMETKSVSKTWF